MGFVKTSAQMGHVSSCSVTSMSTLAEDPPLNGLCWISMNVLELRLTFQCYCVMHGSLFHVNCCKIFKRKYTNSCDISYGV